MDYKTAEDKIIQAYFRDEIKPLQPQFCFCGTLAGGDKWYKGDVNYNYPEYHRMEMALFSGIEKIDGVNWCDNSRGEWDEENPSVSEDGLFNGMQEALKTLKKIHIDRGENIEPVPFKKRQLAESRF